MSQVTAGYVFTGSSDPITFSKLNLLGTPTVTPSNGEITAAMCSASGIGYVTGTGGSVTQQTNKSTGVTLNTITGVITMNNAALNDATNVTFQVTNSLVAATDTAIVCHASGGTLGVYQLQAHTFVAGSFKIMVRNVSGGPLGEAIVINYSVIKGASA